MTISKINIQYMMPLALLPILCLSASQWTLVTMPQAVCEIDLQACDVVSNSISNCSCLAKIVFGMNVDGLLQALYWVVKWRPSRVQNLGVNFPKNNWFNQNTGQENWDISLGNRIQMKTSIKSKYLLIIPCTCMNWWRWCLDEHQHILNS